MSDFLQNLKNHLQTDRIIEDEASCAPFLQDWRTRFHGKTQAVCLPHNTTEVATIVKIAHAHNMQVFTQGGNTGLVGAAIPDQSDRNVLISTRKLNQILQADYQNRSIIAQSGATIVEIQEAADKIGLHFPLSLASEGSATVGGTLASNAGGVAVLRYGNMRELCLGLEIVLSDGRVLNTLKSLRKNNSGFDLKQAFIGSEGTLGIITAASLRLFTKPARTLCAWIACDSPADALEIYADVMQHFDAQVTAFELISQRCLHLIEEHFPEKGIPFYTPWAVLLELSAPEAFADTLDATFLAWAERKIAHKEAVIAKNEFEQKAFWNVRESFSAAQTREGVSIKHDIAVPIGQIPEFLEHCETALRREFPNCQLTIFGHLGDGNLHYNVRTRGNDSLEDEARVNEIVFRIAYQFGGTLSAEHGIGRLRRDCLPHFLDDVQLESMRALKNCFDPEHVFSPNVLLQQHF